jgi:hypothetical protein
VAASQAASDPASPLLRRLPTSEPFKKGSGTYFASLLKAFAQVNPEEAAEVAPLGTQPESLQALAVEKQGPVPTIDFSSGFYQLQEPVTGGVWCHFCRQIVHGGTSTRRRSPRVAPTCL